ncbi:hypothetical protein ACFOWE_08335 [Planomonospora corallina]|uniref:DivIVA domain-containing protein n=1 Tax=Planomonospora corallina TaxID=1806052 RepID=A0ABV8I5E5_9ACTN
MLVVLVLAALAILGGVVVVAMGKGGELTEFAPDVPPLALPDAGKLTAVDFVSLQLPVSLVGYHTQSVDEALQRVAYALSERDTRIAVLEQRVSELLESKLQARHDLHAPPPYVPASEHVPGFPGGDPAEPEDGAPEPEGREPEDREPGENLTDPGREPSTPGEREAGRDGAAERSEEQG